jgi:hypothetical protein
MHWRNFSFPEKILALIITIILVGLTYYVTQYLIQGEITLSSSNDKVWAFQHKDATPYTLPHTFRLRPGRYIFTFGAVGYSDHQERITVYPFLRRQKTVTLIPATSQPINTAQASTLDKLLPYSDDQHFDVDFGRQNGTYEITLHENETWFDSNEDYRKALKNDKERALDWLKAQGVDVQKISIEWLPFNPDG